jgi:hypothetical protein
MSPLTSDRDRSEEIHNRERFTGSAAGWAMLVILIALVVLAIALITRSPTVVFIVIALIWIAGAGLAVVENARRR